MLIAQISDLHIKPRGTLLYGMVDAYSQTEAVINRLCALAPKPDTVIISGDIANDGTDQDYAAACEQLARLDIPIVAALGNHDRREPARHALAGLCTLPQSGPFCHERRIGELRILVLDSLVEGEAGGRLGTTQLDWLDQKLATDSSQPALLVVHHPPFACGIAFMDRIGLADADELAGVVARHGQILGIVSGHIHRAAHTSFAGTIAMTAPGIVHQVVVDLTADGQPAWLTEPAGFLLHRWDGANLVSHLVPVADHGAGHAFSDDHTISRPTSAIRDSAC